MTRRLRSKGLSPNLRRRAAITTLVLAALPAASMLRAADTLPVTDVLQTGGDDSSPGTLFDRAKAAIVQVRSGEKGFILAGSGFFIDDHGTILTSSSILGDNTTARVVINGIEMDAKIIGNDPRSGLAMLRAQYDESPWLPLARPSTGPGTTGTNPVKTGDNVTLVGFPMSLPVAASQGQVSGFDASYLTKADKPAADGKNLSAIERFATTHIHANVPISPGQVGGPLLNAHGEVIGLVATSPDNGQTIYALPTDAMLKIVSDFNIYGKARHGWVGIYVIEAPDINHDNRTVHVVHLAADSPVSKSGIQVGDTVMRIDSREVYRPSDVQDASFFSHVGGNMTVVVRRDDKLYNYSFNIIERPANPAAVPAPAMTSAPAPGTKPMMANREDK